MVGPLSSEEIEDVVSSVRRLVSNEQSDRRATRDLAADRLLLTPALRIISEVSPLSPLILEDREQDETPKPSLTPETEATSEIDKVMSADVQDVGIEGEPPAELIEADWEDEIWAAPEVVSLGEVALGAEEAEVLVPPVEEDVADFLGEAEETAETWTQTEVGWSDNEPIPFIPLRRRAEHLAARLAAGEVMEPESDNEEDGQEVFPVSSTTDVAQELLEDDVLAEDLDGDAPVARGVEDHDHDDGKTRRMPTEILDADGTPLAVLDEAALQEIVRQMIRDELQGALGERITRNVRKLVRAEINRALVARDLD